jgi:predicted ATP-binding protein involved in virulence
MMLALVADIAIKAVTQNNSLVNPSALATAFTERTPRVLTESPGVILIDELDVHLHPKWQRTVVKNLTEAFPNVQFVATTHSPQVIGEVPADQIILLQKAGPPLHPAQAFGMDCNWILRHIMDSENRNPEVAAKLEEIFTAIREAKLTKASKLIAELRSLTGEMPDLAAAEAKIARAELLVNGSKKKKTAAK